MSELSYKNEAARAYDRGVAHVSTHFVPFLRTGNRSLSRMAASTQCCAALASCSSPTRPAASRSFIASYAETDAPVSVTTTPDRSYNGRINVMIARHLTS